MCGIAGVVGFRQRADEAAVRAMCRAMHHRGPDDEGVFLSADGLCALGNRRLAIIDLSASGHMPMESMDGRYWITYNGELYDFGELRTELERRGRRFRSQTDTEVVLALYEEYGPACVQRMNGIFAFAIWDTVQETLFLARDRMGVKPLYYGLSSGRLVFASEIRALLSSGLVERRADLHAIAGFLTLGSVPDSHTILQGIQSLPPAGYAVVQGGEIRVERYWSHAELLERGAGLPREDMAEAVREAVKGAVKRHMVSDVPIGLFLSGGIDSSMLAAVTRATGHEHIRSTSIVFEEQQFDESRAALETAQRFGLDHSETCITAADVQRELPDVFGAMDQPSIDGVNTYFVSWAARQAGLTVALSGLGADELFGGYASFSAVPRLRVVLGTMQRIPRIEALKETLAGLPGVPYRLRKLAAWEGSPATIPGAYAVMRGVLPPEEVNALVEGGAAFDPFEYADSVADLNGLEPRRAISLLESRTYMHNQLLRDTDAMSMAHSLEVRVPYLDAAVVEIAARCTQRLAGGPKNVLIEARSLYFPVGEERGPKRGFTFPFQRWLAGPLGDEIRAGGQVDTFLSKNAVSELWNGYLQGRRHWSAVWAVVVLGQWLQAHRVTAG